MARLYSDTEIAALLSRAAERQRAAPADGPATGLTLDEIERLAADAGLDPAHVRAAAAEMDGTAPAASHAAGVRTLERWLDVPFSEAGWEDVVTGLRARYGTNMATYTAAGTMTGPDTSRVGAGHEWTHTSMSGSTTTVAVSPRGDRTRVRVSFRSWSGGSSDAATAGVWGALLGLLPAMGVSVYGIETGLGGLTLLWALLTVAAVTALSAVLGAPRVRRRREREARRLAETLEIVAAGLEEGAAHDAALAGAAPAGERSALPGRVDFDAAVGDAAPDADEAARERRRDRA